MTQLFCTGFDRVDAKDLETFMSKTSAEDKAKHEMVVLEIRVKDGGVNWIGPAGHISINVSESGIQIYRTDLPDVIDAK